MNVLIWFIIAHSDSSGRVLSANGTLAYDNYGIAATKNNAVVGAFGYTGQVYFPTLGLWCYEYDKYGKLIGEIAPKGNSTNLQSCQ